VGLGRWLRDPPAPTALTADSLRRRIIGPFLREYLNRLLDEQDCPVELRVTTAPGLAELTDREQIVPTDASARLIQLSRAMPAWRCRACSARPGRRSRSPGCSSIRGGGCRISPRPTWSWRAASSRWRSAWCCWPPGRAHGRGGALSQACPTRPRPG